MSGDIVAIQGSGTDGVLTIETASGLVVKIKLTAETELRGTGHDDVAFADLEAGVKVNDQGEPTEAEGDATIVAHKVMAHLGHGKRD